jgi:hypothetical protein
MNCFIASAFDQMDLDESSDDFAGKPPCRIRQRKLGHHQAGFEEERKTWGDETAQAAKQHILSDLKMESRTEDQPLPRNQEHYVRMGLF